jgi:hypothetical protein
MEDFIRVVCRVRPPNSKEAGPACLNLRKSITIDNDSESLTIDTKPEPKSFAFDYVAREDTAQEEIFKQVGAPITEACLQGFNATIIAYGPTGTGKSYTIFGGNHDGQDAASSTNSQRGLVPRALEYIFQYLREHQEKDLDSVAAKVTTTAKCSFYEIYQERVYDLLDSNNCNASSSSSLQVREDSKRGIFVDGITEEIVNSSEEANQVLQNGYRNRHVGQTNMNRESSRSHAIFVLTLNINVEQENGTMKNRMSRFNLVDLAGSERQKDTQASGDRLKEASMINKSLSTLGNVINALSEKSSAKSRHINFRDSKLTFLLRDSLGGNTKTVLVATLSPSMGCVDETLSTLKFAQRAKNISSIVVRNEETTGSVLALQREIEALKAQLMSLSLPIRPAEEKLESESQSESKSMLPRLQDSGAQVATLLASLSSSLQRCQVLDEQRKRNEAGSAALTSRLEQNEKIVLGLEMKLKMRDSEIQRLKKSQPANADTENSEHCIEGLRSQLVDSNLTKEKIQADLLKYRQIFEEVQKRIKQDTQIDIAATGLDENVSIKGLFKVLWTPSEENMFQHAMVETVFKLEQIQSEQLARFDDLANSEFEALTGLCINEAKQLKDKLNATTTELLIANQHRLSSEAQLSMLRQQLNDSESARLELDAKHSLATKSFDEREASMTTIIGNLERELSSRDTVISQLEESVKRIEETSSTQLKQQESEMRTSYLRAMKDNALLIKSFQDLERVHRAAVEKISSQASALQQLELNTAQLVEAHTEEKRQFIETISDTESKLRDTSTKLSACEQSLKETKIELEESLNLVQLMDATFGPGSVNLSAVPVPVDDRIKSGRSNVAARFQVVMSNNFGETFASPLVTYSTIAKAFMNEEQLSSVSIAISDHGFWIYVAIPYAGIMMTSDFGEDGWKDSFVGAYRWRDLACSKNGKYVVGAFGHSRSSDRGVGPHGGIYVSSDYGASWDLATAPNYWYERVVVASSGLLMVATTINCDRALFIPCLGRHDVPSSVSVYVSTNFGHNWTLSKRLGRQMAVGNTFLSVDPQANRMIVYSRTGELFSGVSIEADSRPETYVYSFHYNLHIAQLSSGGDGVVFHVFGSGFANREVVLNFETGLYDRKIAVRAHVINDYELDIKITRTQDAVPASTSASTVAMNSGIMTAISYRLLSVTVSSADGSVLPHTFDVNVDAILTVLPDPGVAPGHTILHETSNRELRILGNGFVGPVCMVYLDPTPFGVYDCTILSNHVLQISLKDDNYGYSDALGWLGVQYHWPYEMDRVPLQVHLYS